MSMLRACCQSAKLNMDNDLSLFCQLSVDPNIEASVTCISAQQDKDVFPIYTATQCCHQELTQTSL